MSYTESDLAHARAMRRKSAAKKSKTPEAKVTAACDKYLASIGAIVIRTNAGSWSDDQGNIIMGAKAGTSDKVVCLPPFRGHSAPFCALELKASAGQSTEAQKAFQARLEALGGIYILAHSAAELRAKLIDHFGEPTVIDWEDQVRARQAAKKARIDDLKRKMGQL